MFRSDQLCNMPYGGLAYLFGNFWKYFWFLILKHQIPLTRAQFKTLLSLKLRTMGVDNKSCNTQGFQIGVITTAKAVGIADIHVQILRE